VSNRLALSKQSRTFRRDREGGRARTGSEKNVPDSGQLDNIGLEGVPRVSAGVAHGDSLLDGCSPQDGFKFHTRERYRNLVLLMFQSKSITTTTTTTTTPMIAVPALFLPLLYSGLMGATNFTSCDM
jgi:hypothetical protein